MGTKLQEMTDGWLDALDEIRFGLYDWYLEINPWAKIDSLEQQIDLQAFEYSDLFLDYCTLDVQRYTLEERVKELEAQVEELQEDIEVWTECGETQSAEIDRLHSIIQFLLNTRKGDVIRYHEVRANSQE